LDYISAIRLAMFSETGAQLLRQTYHMIHERSRTSRFHEAASRQQAAFTDMLQELVNHDHHVACVDIYKGWLEIDTFEDYRRAWAKMK
jgi:phosphoenolpyruvate phosphomutase